MTTPRTLTVRSPEDVLALVVSVLGFQPAESVVMVTRTASASFHARADLPSVTYGPDQIDAIDELAEHLAGAAATNRAQEAIVVTYCADSSLAGAVTSALVASLARRGIGVEMTLREHAGRWYATGETAGGTGERTGEREGTEYDLRVHPFVLESHFLDREIYRDRDELASSLRGTAEQVARTERELAGAAARLSSPGDSGGLSDEDVAGEVGWIRDRVADDAPLSSGEVARIAVVLGVRDVRDGVWMGMSRAGAARWRRRLKEAVRSTPPDLVVEPAALLAFASWLAGDGALAWCAVDLARSGDPEHTLASLVAQALEAAIPPDVWDGPKP